MSHAEPGEPQHTTGENEMKRFIIEREIPGASELSEAELAEISKKSKTAMASLGIPYRWIKSYVAGDKIYCVHEAESADDVLEHARCGGFPANVVTKVSAVIDPSTGE
jgi:hypothetical protein